MLTKNIKKHGGLLILYHKTLLSSCFFHIKNMKKHEKTWKKHEKNMKKHGFSFKEILYYIFI